MPGLWTTARGVGGWLDGHRRGIWGALRNSLSAGLQSNAAGTGQDRKPCGGAAASQSDQQDQAKLMLRTYPLRADSDGVLSVCRTVFEASRWMRPESTFVRVRPGRGLKRAGVLWDRMRQPSMDLPKGVAGGTFAQTDTQWNHCLIAALIVLSETGRRQALSRRPRRNDSGRVQGEGGSCHSARRPDTFGAGKPVRCAPEPDHAMEDPVAGSVGAVIWGRDRAG